jgi:hypothetical protein
MKNLLSKVIYPFIKSPSADPHEIPLLLQHVLNKHTIKPSQTPDVALHHSLVEELFQALLPALPCVTGLIGVEAVAMSDMFITQAVYIVIGPFFIAKASKGDMKGKKDGGALHLIHNILESSVMHGLRLDALLLVCSVSTLIVYSGKNRAAQLHYVQCVSFTPLLALAVGLNSKMKLSSGSSFEIGKPAHNKLYIPSTLGCASRCALQMGEGSDC